MVIAEGSKIGPYEIERQIGSGGMATVYLAYQPRLDRHVAIKVMHPNFSADRQFTSRFEREARIVARLDHPNIVPIYDYDHIGNQPYLVMKHIDGVTLKTVLLKTALSGDDTQQILTPVADALTYAHREGVLHRDIKPSNIIIDQAGRSYLTDFGLARIAQQGESSMSVDTMLGTPYYISPEQAQGKELDARTDIYSLGVVLYELVTGRVPFIADSSFAIVHDHIYSPPPPPREIRPEISDAVEAVLLRALAKRPGDRYATANDLLRAFGAALTNDVSAAVSRPAHKPHGPTAGHIPSIPKPPPIPAPLTIGPDEFAEVKDNLKAAGKEFGEAIKQLVSTTNIKPPRRMMPREGAKWHNEGPEGAGFYTDQELEELDQSLSLEERVSRRVRRKLRERQQLIRKVVTYIALLVLFWAIWGMGSPEAFMWPIIPTIIFALSLVKHSLAYYQQYGGGYDHEQRMIQQELAQARHQLGDRQKAKRDEIPTNVRLTGDGEFTESFIQQLDDDYESNQR
jgi:serine/threonine protein kinase